MMIVYYDEHGVERFIVLSGLIIDTVVLETRELKYRSLWNRSPA